MIFWKRRTQAKNDADDALAAKIQADIDLAAVKQTRREVAEQSNKIRAINQQNHFSEGLQRSFRGRPV